MGFRHSVFCICRLRLKCDGARAETRFRLSAKRPSPFKSAGASIQSTTVNRDVRISGSNAGYTMFRGSVKNAGYPLHSPVSPSLPLPCVTVCHHISTGFYLLIPLRWKYSSSRKIILCNTHSLPYVLVSVFIDVFFLSRVVFGTLCIKGRKHKNSYLLRSNNAPSAQFNKAIPRVRLR